ncbi:hypothetical protein PENSUB_8577 [Penicillium subrubescens]|uniref:Uncharacterized protein n=1 Tax=Penicillium subrubescens TaxID=1316194 RepID=A0A1Q5TG50_9EURO|nr:hypothetical protein PENSUB_8577 [Penicillium subrubescens]
MAEKVASRDVEDVMGYSESDIVDPAREAAEKALVWKQDRRIVPLCAAIYLLCYLDRSNIGEHC